MPRQGHQRGAATSMGQAPAPVDFVAEILCCCDGNVDGGASEHGDAAEADVQGGRAFKSKNLETERRRRAKLKHQLFTLRSLVPRITKMSKEATLTDAVDYIQELERQKEELQKELKEMAEEDVEKQGSASSSGAILEHRNLCTSRHAYSTLWEDVEVRPLGKNKFLAGIVCRNKRGGFTRMVEAVGSLGLEVTDASFLTLDGVSQIMLCMEKARGDRAVAGDKVRDLLLWAI